VLNSVISSSHKHFRTIRLVDSARSIVDLPIQLPRLESMPSTSGQPDVDAPLFNIIMAMFSKNEIGSCLFSNQIAHLVSLAENVIH
jgi:hypothetical protein